MRGEAKSAEKREAEATTKLEHQATLTLEHGMAYKIEMKFKISKTKMKWRTEICEKALSATTLESKVGPDRQGC